MREMQMEKRKSMPDRSNEPDVVRIAREYKAALLAREDAQLKYMAKRYIEIERSLAADVYALVMELAQLQAEGKVITPALIKNITRYQKIQAELKREIRKFVDDTAIPSIRAEQLTFAQMGVDMGASQFKTSGGLGIVFNVLGRDALEQYVGMTGDGSPLKRLLSSAYGETADGVLASLLDGFARGLNPVTIAKQTSMKFGIGLDRITTIARTEQLRAYRMSSLEQYRETDAVIGYKRISARDDRTCLACLALDGKIYKLDTELADHPRGRCATVPIVRGAKMPTWQTGAQWFEKLPSDMQERMMGAGRYQLWRDGQFKFSDIAGNSYSPIWGDSPRVKTVAELKK